MLHAILVLIIIGALGILLTRQAAISVWAISFALFSALVFYYGHPGLVTQILLVLVELVLITGAIKPLRRTLLSKYFFKIVSKAMPAMSSTEREALEAGTVSWEGDLFSGAPDFSVLRNAPTVCLTDEEQAFLDGPVNTLCAMIDDWDITHNLTDLPPEIWQFIKENRFLRNDYSQTLWWYRIFCYSTNVDFSENLWSFNYSATTISVPNSLGPGELLLHYGTEEQKNYYLPRLADGREIPCFAFTGPNAGSDAGSIPDKGIVCHEEFEGKKVLGMRSELG